jgi:hypothetical protein
MPNRNSIIDKIKALLAKTTENGATEAEMLSALDKASAMRDAHEITDEELQITKDEAALLHAEQPDLKDPHSIKWRLYLSREARDWFAIYRNAKRRAVRRMANRQPRRFCVRRALCASHWLSRTAQRAPDCHPLIRHGLL